MSDWWDRLYMIFILINDNTYIQHIIINRYFSFLVYYICINIKNKFFFMRKLKDQYFILYCAMNIFMMWYTLYTFYHTNDRYIPTWRVHLKRKKNRLKGNFPYFSFIFFILMFTFSYGNKHNVVVNDCNYAI